MRKSKLLLSFILIISTLFVMSSCIDQFWGGSSDDGNTVCDHSWGKAVVVEKPTCGTNEKGISRQTCTKCGEIRDNVKSPYKSHQLEEIIVNEATCGKDGLMRKQCKECNYYEEYKIDALAHEIVLMEVPYAPGEYAFMCPNCGEIETYTDIVYYEDFGAVGDGKTDDFAAIRAAHEAANRLGLPVEGSKGATYYIGVIDKTIYIQTNTDWKGATFIFDDALIRWDDSFHRGINVFGIVPSSATKKITVPKGFSLSKGQANIGMSFDQPYMLKIVNSDEKIYLRYGVNANDGTDKYEFILVDRNGQVDPSTPIQYDYSKLTEITAYPITDEPIFVGNAKIITKAPNPKAYDSDYENNYCYFSRGIGVQRSNATLYEIEHVIVGEDMTVEIDRNNDGKIDKWGADKSYGVPYAGFFHFKNCYNATMTDCIVQGHQAYSFYQGTSRNEMGSYDINATGCVNLNLLNLTQYENEATGEVITNRFMYHGVMGSNFCRNVVMDNCRLDRFDSHQGLYNATITNSELGFGLLVIGGGELYIENVTRLSGDAFILLRTDYNSVFDGDVIIKNCKMTSAVTSIITGQWRSFYNGLPNYMTKSLTIDGLTVESSKIYLYKVSASPSATSDSVNPLYLPENVKVSGVKRVLYGITVSATVEASYYSDSAFSNITIK